MVAFLSSILFYAFIFFVLIFIFGGKDARNNIKATLIFVSVAAVTSVFGPIFAVFTWSTLGIAAVGLPLLIAGVVGTVVSIMKGNVKYRWLVIAVMGLFWLLIPVLSPTAPDLDQYQEALNSENADVAAEAMKNAGASVGQYIWDNLGAFINSLLLWMALTLIVLVCRWARVGKA